VTRIIVADPSLIVLVGAAGSGKSTFAARHFAPAEILSSDAYRALIAGDETDQRATKPAFGRLHRELGQRLAAGQLSVVDATNIEPAARRALVTRAAGASLPATAVVLDLPPSLVLARNAAVRAGSSPRPSSAAISNGCGSRSTDARRPLTVRASARSSSCEIRPRSTR